MIEKLLFISAIFSVLVVFFILVFLFGKGYQIFEEVTLWEFLTGDKWDPVGQNIEEKPYYGAHPLIMGTLLVTLGAMAFAIPLGIGSAIFISEIAPPRIRDFLKTGTELLAGIPSVVYGLFGLIILTRWLQINFDKPTGETWLAG
ncbi:MAG: phosphate ABC transporter permease, partial [Thermoplasmata archaeon]|nr:phosphate ABC transporter permease [Thermoplasmata archaeon]